ncbi:hypothetical protein EAH79_01550 [Sphingomonas koreensis]|nr:hypothetical protein EAH79_01550 [Sphingomonas koreensis]
MNATGKIVAVVASLVLAGAAQAQTSVKSTHVVKTSHTVNDGGPQHGANSFTEEQARGHIMHAGFTNVAALTKDGGGVWRGTARKGGRTVNVALDFKGNVSTNQ